MAAAGDTSVDALKDYLSRLAESNQICKVVIVSCLMVLFYDWGEQSVCFSKTHRRLSLLDSHLYRLGGSWFPYILFIYADQPLTGCYNLGMVSFPEPSNMKANWSIDWQTHPLKVPLHYGTPFRPVCRKF